MTRYLLIWVCLLLSFQAVNAQSPKRRAQQQEQARKKAETPTLRSQISFPTSVGPQEDVVWRRDVYRELDLTHPANGGLYYPVEPSGSQMNLFTYIFKLFMTGNIRAYEYRLDGNEVFSDTSVVNRKAFLDNYHIYYERTDRGVHIDDSDIPSREVKAYYIKEASYYDQTTATFHTKVLALCPIMSRDDDFSFTPSKYPLFWVKYDDLAPFLSKQTMMTSDVNNAATMSVDDFFTSNQYRGKIYKTNNMLGQTLAQYCPTDSAMSKEQQRIEREIATFESRMWGDRARKDSLDSIAKLDQKQVKTVKKTNRRSRTTTVRTNRRARGASKASSGSATVTVRRERH
uniref:Gliding motility protein GldN n=1 Tax=Prevotella sp. GTC17262 TaxID=3236797 RepID=A0AB33JN73_9BACT